MSYAVGTLTASGAIANANTVTIGGKVYTFEDVLTNVDGHVKVGADAEESLANLKAAINLESGAGTAYAALTVANPHVRATFADAATVVVTSKVEGAIGNFITTTESGANTAWGGAVLASGSGDLSALLRSAVAGAGAGLKQTIINLTDPEGDE